MQNRWQRLMDLLREQLRLLLTINPSDRRWQMPFACFRRVLGAPMRRMDPALRIANNSV